MAFAALTLAAATVLGFGQVLRRVVDRGFTRGSGAELDQVLLLFLLVVLIMALSVAARVYLTSWVGERVVADIRKHVFSHVLRLDSAFFEITRTGEVISRLTADTSLLQLVVGSTMAIAVRNTLLFTGGVAMLAFTSPKLTVLVLCGVPLVIVPLWLLGHRVRRLSGAAQDRLADVGGYIDEVLHGIRTVQAFCHEAVDRQRYGERVEDAFRSAIERTRVSALLTGIIILFTFGSIGVVLWVGGHDVIAGRITGGELSAFVFYAVLVAGSVGALSEVAGDLMRAAGAAERLMALAVTQPKICAPAAPRSLPAHPRGAVAFREVTFAYPSRSDSPALRGFSLQIEAGEKVALVGPSGAGKTTVFQLLMRFYDPQRGAITFDDIALSDLAPKTLRSQIALVPQEPVIFGADAWENIRYGHQDSSDEAVLRAARAAHAAEFLEQLPEGLRTFLGERGVRLSGGQRQRIAIARAVLRNPKLLLLDEATSALDAESERLVQHALDELSTGRTTLVIAHRLATVRKVDRIVVLDRGQVVASGRHDQLVAEGGLYARLATLQFRDVSAVATAGSVDSGAAHRLHG